MAKLSEKQLLEIIEGLEKPISEEFPTLELDVAVQVLSYLFDIDEVGAGFRIALARGEIDGDIVEESAS